MSYEANARCTCTNCPGGSCQCGCQAAASPVETSYAALACRCGPACRCSAADQGCLCGR